MPVTIHFLLVFDHHAGRLIGRRTFKDADEAARAYADAEYENRDQGNLEIVLVGADKIETIYRTHG